MPSRYHVGVAVGSVLLFVAGCSNDASPVTVPSTSTTQAPAPTPSIESAGPGRTVPIASFEVVLSIATTGTAHRDPVSNCPILMADDVYVPVLDDVRSVRALMIFPLGGELTDDGEGIYQPWREVIVPIDGSLIDIGGLPSWPPNDEELADPVVARCLDQSGVDMLIHVG